MKTSEIIDFSFMMSRLFFGVSYLFWYGFFIDDDIKTNTTNALFSIDFISCMVEAIIIPFEKEYITGITNLFNFSISIVNIIIPICNYMEYKSLFVLFLSYGVINMHVTSLIFLKQYVYNKNTKIYNEYEFYQPV